jgi:hypothetical protein
MGKGSGRSPPQREEIAGKSDVFAIRQRKFGKISMSRFHKNGAMELSTSPVQPSSESVATMWGKIKQ